MNNYNQLLIDDYKQTIERLQKECTEKTDLNIKLMTRIKELEKEYKSLEKQFNIVYDDLRYMNVYQCKNVVIIQ